MQYPPARSAHQRKKQKKTLARCQIAAAGKRQTQQRENKTRLRDQYRGGDGYRARAFAYSLGCFFDAFALRALVFRFVSVCP